MMVTTYTRGFTLIEVIVYLALLSVIMVSLFSTSLSLIQSAGRNTTDARVAEEGDFLLMKVQQALVNATSVSTPTTGEQSKTLFVYDTTGANTDGTPISVSNSVELSTLVASDLSLLGTTFYHAPAIGGIPESVGVHFTLTTFTPQGRMVSQDFSATTSLAY